MFFVMYFFKMFLSMTGIEFFGIIVHFDTLSSVFEYKTLIRDKIHLNLYRMEVVLQLDILLEDLWGIWWGIELDFLLLDEVMGQQ